MIEIIADEVVNFEVKKEPVTGYLAWYRSASSPHWLFLMNSHVNSDPSLCPYPMFKSPEDVPVAIRKIFINTDDLTIKLLKVTL